MRHRRLDRCNRARTATGALPACLIASTCLAGPPTISGGAWLSDAIGDNPQMVRTYETSSPYTVTFFDPDAGDALFYQIVVDGPLGGVIGGAVDGSAAAGIPVDLPVQFISGVVPGASWLKIHVSDGSAFDTAYINFDIVAHPSPPPGQMFRVSNVDAAYPYHFNVLVTDPAEIQQGLAILSGLTPQEIVGGHIVKGDAGFNVNLQDPEQASWSWYLDPASVIFDQAFIEVCDGQNCYVEEDLPYWINQLGYFCPWTTHLLPHAPAQPAASLLIAVEGGADAVILWDPVPGATHYDVARGDLASLTKQGCSIGIDPLTCLAEDTSVTSSAPDSDLPPLGEGYFYLVRYDGPSTGVGYGTSSFRFYREATTGCAP